jgi:hypothetical protein
MTTSVTFTTIGASITGNADGWENVCYAANSLILCIIGFAVPIYLGYKEHKKDQKSNSSSSSTEHVDTKRLTRSVLGFHGHPKIVAVLSTSESLQFLEEYLVNVQEVEMSHWLLLWNNINMWKGLEVR